MTTGIFQLGSSFHCKIIIYIKDLQQYDLTGTTCSLHNNNNNDNNNNNNNNNKNNKILLLLLVITFNNTM